MREFLASYQLFDQEHVTGKNREAENTVNYYKASGAMVQFDKTYIYYKQFLHLENHPISTSAKLVMCLRIFTSRKKKCLGIKKFIQSESFAWLG